MLIRILTFLFLLNSAAYAAPPTITAPAAVTAASAVATPIKGISIAEPGASPLATYTVTLTDVSGLLSATGTVAGAGTASLTIGPVTLPGITTALGTITFTGQADTIMINVKDSTSQNATPVTVQVQTIPGGFQYIVYSTQALALARSQTQCGAVKCDGVKTQYWWNVIGPLNAGTAGLQSVAANSYAVEVRPGDPYFDATTKTVAACAVGCGLTPPEQATLVTAAQIAPLVSTTAGQ